MGGKIKSIFMLIVLLMMIYLQHSPVLHAEAVNVGDSSVQEETEEPEPGKPVPEEPEKPEPEEPEKPEPEEPEPVKEYELRLEEPDGKNGYYITVPEAELCHVSRRGHTVYRLENGGVVRAEGRLEKEGDAVVLSGEQFGEGENILTLYMEDETGDRLEEYGQIRRIMVDTRAPVIDASAPDGFDAWYQQETWISASAEDGEPGSGIAEISAYCGGQLLGTAPDAHGSFLVSKVSERGMGAAVTITASDRAGHTCSITRTLYIDGSAPEVEIDGVKDYMITSMPVRAVFKIAEENTLKEWAAQTEWEAPDGGRHTLPAEEWTGDAGRQEAVCDFSRDGIYRMKLSASDLAGNSDVKEAQIIIDSQNPVIKYVDRLDGRYMKKFCWNYPREVFIEDFTTYNYEIKLDDRLYAIGEEVAEEGYHVLKVGAEDAAGNKAEAEAGFTVDHTPPQIIFTDVEEGGIYEEEKLCKAALGDSEDEIQEVRINGVLQASKAAGQTYQYTVQECGDYEIFVRACDKAGNEAESAVSFKVVPKESFLQKAVKPVKKLFSKKNEEQNPGKERSGSKSTGSRVPVLPAAAVCGLGGIGAAAVFYRKFH